MEFSDKNVRFIKSSVDVVVVDVGRRKETESFVCDKQTPGQTGPGTGWWERVGG